MSATAGQGLTIAVQGLAHAPDVDYGSSAIELLKPDGGRVESRSCLTAYVPVFAARMQFLLPEWGGDFAAVDRFVRTATERTEALEGRAMYAWLYLELARRYGGLLDRSLVSWPEMRSAFEDMAERHPDVWNRNVYATFACRARDADTTLRLLGELGAAAALGMWSPGVSTESCLRMVRTPPPPLRQS